MDLYCTVQYTYCSLYRARAPVDSAPSRGPGTGIYNMDGYYQVESDALQLLYSPTQPKSIDLTAQRGGGIMASAVDPVATLLRSLPVKQEAASELLMRLEKRLEQRAAGVAKLSPSLACRARLLTQCYLPCHHRGGSTRG